jgi:hypothetical protein
LLTPTTATRLREAQKAFTRWRKTRLSRSRIPEPLWNLAVSLAGELGVHPVSKALRVNYERLKAYVQETEGVTAEARSQKSAPVFVEVDMSTQPAALGDCLIELEDACGARMRMQLRGPLNVDIVGLSKSFWDGGA